MASHHFAASRAAREIQLLQFVCDAARDESARDAVLRLLADYTWLESDNEILFEAVRGIFARSPRDIASHLPAELTRRGFPDLPWEPLRGPSRIESAAALAFAEELRRRSKGKE